MIASDNVNSLILTQTLQTVRRKELKVPESLMRYIVGSLALPSQR